MNPDDLYKYLENCGVQLQEYSYTPVAPNNPWLSISFKGYLNTNKEQINELEGIEKMEKILTQNNAVNAVKAHRIVIGSFDSNGNFSVAPSPTLQLSTATARAECRRLATLNPGKLFTFMTLNGGELVPSSTMSL